MSEIDSILDEHPSPSLITELAELGIRNRQCFAELKKYDATGRWIGGHPLLQFDKELVYLQDMLSNNLSDFLEEYRSAANNLSRYRSYLAKTADKQKKEAYEKQIEKHENHIHVIIQVLTDYVAKQPE